MGIDIYMKWRGMSKKDKESQMMGFSVTHGHTGYLREAYHGEPYATKELVPESFNSKTGEAKIKAEILSQRLPRVLELAAERNINLYNGDHQEGVLQSYRDFVGLAEKMEAKTGTPVTIIASY